MALTNSLGFLCAALLAAVATGVSSGQSVGSVNEATPGRVYTDADYARAEKFMAYNVNPLVLHEVDSPTWFPDGRFWYRDTGAEGNTFYIVDPAKGTKKPAFDQQKLAHALAPLAPPGHPFDPYRLPIFGFELRDNDQTVVLGDPGQQLSCDLSGEGVCRPVEQGPPPTGRRGRKRGGDAGGIDVAPDGKKAVFIRDWNLWERELPSGEETQLTFDGVPNYGYATDNAGWTHSDNPIVVWSPDSKEVATFQQDQRKDGEMYLTNVTSGHPTLTTLKYPLPGDKDVTMIERVVIHLPAGPGGKATVVRLKMPPDQHRSSLCDDVSCKGGSGWDDVEWSKDSKSLMFVSTSRDHKQENVRVANPDTGAVRDVFGETAATYFESGNDKVNWHYLSASNQVLWFSERSGWGQLYLYDAGTGKLLDQVTGTGPGGGDWNVTQVLGVDEAARTVYFVGVGRERGEDPYYQMYYSARLDGSAVTLLTPERSNHVITPSPDNRYFVDAYSTPSKPQITEVRDSAGKVVMGVAHEDISRLEATGWQPPVQIQVKARDGVTDLYGFLFRPTSFSTDGHYPLVDHVYPGPQGGWGGLSCGDRAFHAAHGDLQSVAELGFVTVCIDGMGGAYRSKAFHNVSFQNQNDDTIPDVVTGIKQLQDRYPWIDRNRIGIFGHSGGGSATASAMFNFPDFFKVGIAESGNHENRSYEDDWDEKYIGLLVKNPDGTSNYDSQANESKAKNLKGHLLLAHGTMDDNVPLNNTLLVVDALIKNNKDFDLILFPNEHHGYGAGAQYMTRRRWDYWVRYLAGATPPFEYKMRDYSSVQRAMAGLGPADVDWSATEPSAAPLAPSAP